jgi:hypothetical protein
MPGHACARCGSRTQPETVVRLRLTLRGTRADTARGWYCWTCKASASGEPLEASAPPPQHGLPTWLLSAACGLGLRPRAPLRREADSWGG